MKKIIASALLLGICALPLSACGNDGIFSDRETLSGKYVRSADIETTYNFSDGASDPPLAYNSYANLMISLDLKILRNKFAQNDSSFVFSPAATVLQLSELTNGAKGDTLSELLLTLGNDLDVDTLNQCSSYFKSRMENVSKIGAGQTDQLSGKVIEESETEFVRLNSALLFNDITDVRTPFLQKNADFYGSDIFRFDFSSPSAKEKTEKYFDGKNFPALDDSAAMIFANSAEISDVWLEPYTKTQLDNGVFHGENGNSETVFMISNESYMHTETAGGVIKYTAKTPLKLLLIMPEEGIDLSEYIKTFDSNQLMDLLDSVDITKKTAARIPQFKAASDDSKMSDVLQKCGLYTLFGDTADFGNLAHTDDVTLNEIYDFTASLSVTADGINRSTASASGGSAKLSDIGETEEGFENSSSVTFDRPFLFLLIDNESSIPVLAGAYR